MPNSMKFGFKDIDDRVRDKALREIGEFGYTRLGMPLDVNIVEALSKLSQTAWSLPRDIYYKDGVRYRTLNRYQVLLSADEIEISCDDTDQPYFQNRNYNTTLGGIDREYPPLPSDVSFHEGLCRLICSYVCRLPLSETTREFQVNLHTMRFAATLDKPCDTSPPGFHKDGEKYIAVTMLSFCGCNGGEVHIADNSKVEKDRFTMRQMGESYIIDDDMVWHKLSPVSVSEGARFAIRDVALFDFIPKTAALGVSAP